MIQKNIGCYEAEREIFKDYLLKDIIGKGRYGAVYLVHNRARNRALKIFNQKIDWESSDSSGDDGHFSVNHPNVDRIGSTNGTLSILNDFDSPYMVDIVDYGETVCSQSCVLMEHMNLSLETLLQSEHKLNESRAVLYLTGILKGLQLQEMYGIIHRDIKPSNLFIVADTVKAGDHAFITSGAVTSAVEADFQEAYGTPEYSAPEVFDCCYSSAADRWAAAVIFFRMLTGVLPFSGDSILDIMFEVMNGSPDYSILPEKFRPFMERCFQKNVKNRHADAEEMLSEMEDCIIGDKRYYHAGALEFTTEPGSGSLGPASDRDSVIGPAGVTPDESADSGDEMVNVTAGSCKTAEIEESTEIASSTECDVNLRSAESGLHMKPVQKHVLRKNPLFIPESEAGSILMIDPNGRPLRYIQNCYSDNGDGTVFDRSTGLLWQKTGSEVNFSYHAAEEYVESLNLNMFAGYSDWRIPTVDELISLLEPDKVSGYLHISEFFDSRQQWCWSSDKRTKGSGWYVFFYSGNINWDFLDLDNYVRAVRG